MPMKKPVQYTARKYERSENSCCEQVKVLLLCVLPRLLARIVSSLGCKRVRVFRIAAFGWAWLHRKCRGCLKLETRGGHL